MRPAIKEPANKNMSQVSATEYPGMCRTCSSTEGLIVTTAALSVPSSSHSALPKANNVGVIAEESTTMVKKPPLLFKDKQNVDIEIITTTTKYPGGESTHVISTEASMTSAPTSVSLGKTPVDNSGHLSMPGIIQTGKDSVVTTPLSSPLSTPSIPTSTKFSKRKTPLHQIFVNNQKKEGMLKNPYQFGLQKNTATKLPKIAPLLPTGQSSPSHSTTLLTSPPPTLSTTMAATQHRGSEVVQGARSLSAGKEQPFTNTSPVLPSTISKKSNTLNFLSTEIPTVTTPTATASVIISETQRTRSKEAKDQIKGPRKNRNNPNTTPRQISGYSAYSALTTADTPLAFSHSPRQDDGRTVSAVAYHSTTSLLGITEPSEKYTQTLGNTTALETTLLSKSQESTTVKRASDIPPPLLCCLFPHP